MSRMRAARRGLLLILLGLVGSGCVSASVAWMQPRANGSVEFVLFARSRSPNLGIKSGGEWRIDDVTAVDERVLWKEGVPPRFVGKSQQTTAPLEGLVPLYSVPVTLCSPPGGCGGVRGAAARRRVDRLVPVE